MPDEPTVRPFSCGTQYLDWQWANCATCAKRAPDDAHLGEMPCEIEAALVLAQFDAGLIPLPIADRMGRDGGRYVWPCREHDPPFKNVRPDGTVDPTAKKED